MEFITVPATLRYFPLMPCPWRHDPSIKPSSTTSRNTNKTVSVTEEVQFLKEYWSVPLGNTEAIDRHVLFDLDSWYLHGLGLFPFDLTVLRGKAEKAIQCLLSHGETNLKADQVTAITDVYDLLPTFKCTQLRDLVNQVEALKLEPRGTLFLEAVRSEPFHLRAATTLDQKTVVTRPAGDLRMPHAFAEMAVAHRQYTATENAILDALLLAAE